MYSAKTMLAGVVGMTLLIGAAPAVAQVQSLQSQTSSTTAKSKDPNRIICQRVQETGSRLAAKRVCLTSQQWQDQQRRDRDMLEEQQRRTAGPTSG